MGQFCKGFAERVYRYSRFILSSYFMVSENKTVMSTVQGVFSPKFVDRLNLIKTELKSISAVILKCRNTYVYRVCDYVYRTGILDIEYALLIALGIAFLDALPFFGSGLVLWPWSLISF